MNWKIENIEENDQPVEKKILKNALEMVKSITPKTLNAQSKCSQITKLIKKAETEQGQGPIRNRSVRKSLREAYKLLSELESERRSSSDKQENTTVIGKSWAQNYLDESVNRILKQSCN